MLDIRMLGLIIGLGNFGFALLVILYAASQPVPNRALNLLKWTKLSSGVGITLGMLSTLPFFFSVALANLFFICSRGLELLVYFELLKIKHWERRIAWSLPVVLVAHQAMLIFLSSRTPAVIVQSLIAALVYAGIAYMLFTARLPGRRLPLAMASLATLGGVAFFGRAVKGVLVGHLSVFENTPINVVMYFVGYLGSIASTFGVLLLIKQQDDLDLRRAMQEVGRAESEQRQLLTMAAHEFRTPAAMIKTSLDSLAYFQASITPEVGQRLANIRQAAQRMIHLANHLISQDRFVELALHPERQRIDLTELVADIVASYPGDAAIDIELPDSEVWAEVDPTLLGIAVNNLLDNAVRYSRQPDGSPSPVRVDLQAGPAAITIGVADQGPGIADEAKEKVFERFYNLKGSSSHGIGLSIVRTVAIAHGGRVIARDHFPRGTEMVLTLPVPPPGSVPLP